jgi:hypothetical protein
MEVRTHTWSASFRLHSQHHAVMANMSHSPARCIRRSTDSATFTVRIANALYQCDGLVAAASNATSQRLPLCGTLTEY